MPFGNLELRNERGMITTDPLSLNEIYTLTKFGTTRFHLLDGA
jgi:hypothetical protein